MSIVILMIWSLCGTSIADPTLPVLEENASNTQLPEITPVLMNGPLLPPGVTGNAYYVATIGSGSLANVRLTMRCSGT